MNDESAPRMRCRDCRKPAHACICKGRPAAPKYFIDGKWNGDLGWLPLDKEPREPWRLTPRQRQRYPMLRALYYLTNMRSPKEPEKLKPNVAKLTEWLLAEDYIFPDNPDYERKRAALYERIGQARDKYILGKKTKRAKRKPKKS
jgi:hypothetical protein